MPSTQLVPAALIDKTRLRSPLVIQYVWCQVRSTPHGVPRPEMSAWSAKWSLRVSCEENPMTQKSAAVVIAVLLIGSAIACAALPGAAGRDPRIHPRSILKNNIPVL